MCVFDFELLDEEIVLDQSGVIDLTVVLQKGYLQFFGLLLVEFAIDLQFFGVFQISLGLKLVLLQPDDFELLPFVFPDLGLEFGYHLLYYSFVDSLLDHDGIQFSSVLQPDVVDQVLELTSGHFDLVSGGVRFFLFDNRAPPAGR